MESALALAPRRHETAEPAPSPASRFEVVETLAGLDALAEPWNALAARSALPRQGFQSFAWLRSWAEHYSDCGLALYVVLGWMGDELALVWPLGARQRFGLTSLGFLGEPLCQYHDVLVVDGEAGDRLLAGALDFVRGLPHDVLNLRRIREDSRLGGLLRAAGARVIRRQRAPFIDFGGAKTFDAFELGLSAKARSNRRRRLRHLQDLGVIAFEAPTAPERQEALIAAAMAFKRAWALQGGHFAPSVFDARFERCFRDAARNPGPCAALRVLGVRLDGRVIGVEISFGYRDRLFGHVLAPDPSLAKYGLGNVLADAAIANAFAQGYRIYDLLAPANAYKSAWTDRSVEVTDFSLPATRRGALAMAIVTKAREAGRHMIARAPPALVRALLGRVEKHHGGPLDSFPTGR